MDKIKKNNATDDHPERGFFPSYFYKVEQIQE